MTHRRALDGLRALAVLAVVVFHSTYGTERWQITGGFLGVDLFFVLSGALITALLLTEWQCSHQLRLRGFYARRVLRLGPALAITLVAVVAINYFVGPSSPQPLWEPILATAFYVANWLQVAHPAATTYLDHTWSLSIEEQFYLIWPVALAVMLRRGANPRRVAAVAAGSAVAAAAIRWVWLSMWPSHGVYGYKVLYENTVTRSDSLLIGIVVGCLALDPAFRNLLDGLSARLSHHRWAKRILVDVTPLLALIYLARLMHRATVYSPWLYHYGFTLVAALAGVLVMHCMVVEDSLLVRVLSARPLVAIGRISYGIYLFHVPVALVVLEHTHLAAPARLLVIASISITAATISYLLVEQRATRFGRRIGRPVPTAVESRIPIVATDIGVGIAVAANVAA